MSYTNDNRERPSGGVLGRLFAIVGVAAVAAIGGIGAMYVTSETAADCAARGYSTVLCAAGSVGLVDLGALAAKDTTIETLNRRASEREAEVGAAQARVKEIEAELAQARAEARDAQELRQEIARRDVRIKELGDKLAAAAKPVAPPLPAARPAVPAPAPMPLPVPGAPAKPKG